MSKPLELERGIDAEIHLGANLVQIHSNRHPLGEWTPDEISLERSRGSRFDLIVEGERWVFDADQPERLAFAIHSALFQAGRAESAPPRPEPTSTGRGQEVPSWLKSGALTPFVAAAGASLMFVLGFASGRHVTTATYVIILVTAAGLTGAGWGWHRWWRTRLESVASSDASRLAAAFGRESDLLPEPAEYEVVAKWLASGYLFNLRAWWRWATSSHAPRAVGEASNEQEPNADPTRAPASQPLQAAPTTTSDLDDDVAAPIAAELPTVEAADRQHGDDLDPTAPSSGSPREILLALETLGRSGGPEGLVTPSQSESSPRDPERKASLDPVVYRRVAAWLGDLTSATEGTQQDESDDLRQIRGIGPVFAEALQTLGYHSFADVASMDDQAIDDLERLVGPIRRRMERDAWQESAASLHKAKYGDGAAPS